MKVKLAIMVLLAAILVGQLMPMTLMPEPDDPWYIVTTTIWFLFSGIVYCPAMAVAALLRQPIHGVAHWTLNLAWLAALCLLVWKSKKQRRLRVHLHNTRVQTNAATQSDGHDG